MDDARNVAVLIDFENLNENESLRKVLDHGAKCGNVVIKLAVGNFSVGGDGQRRLQELGIQPVHQSTAGKGKNSSDMRMAIEAIDLFHRPSLPIDVFVLATSDVDFMPLAQWLRASGKRVIGAGRSDALELWQRGVDEFVVVKEVKAEAKASTVSKSQPVGKSKSSQSTKASKAATAGKTAKTNVINPKYKDIVETAISDVFVNGATEVKSRVLLKRIMQLEREFSCRRAGFNSFRKLVASFGRVSIPAKPSTGEFVIRKQGNW